MRKYILGIALAAALMCGTKSYEMCIRDSWQGVSRIFGQNLKSEYDKEGEDRIIEQIVVYYEAGLL